jgi:hypothetical protein
LNPNARKRPSREPVALDSKRQGTGRSPERLGRNETK